jgi:cytochrome b561
MAAYQDATRYSVGARWFHWLTALLVFTVIPLGWIFGGFKTKPDHPDTYVAPFPGTPNDYASAHFTVGLIVFAVIAARILYRATHPAPAWPGAVGRVDALLARATHWMLYAVLIIMPISGYIMTAGDKPPIVLFGVYDLPKLPVTSKQGFVAAVVHVYAQFAVYALIGLHLAGVAWHVFARRDDLLSRMLPPQHYPVRRTGEE